MTIVTVEVATREETNARLLRAFGGEPQGSFISFPTVEALLPSVYTLFALCWVQVH